MLPFPRFRVMSATLLVASCAINLSASPARAQTMNHGEMAAVPPATRSIGQDLLDKLRGLAGTWDAQLGNGVITDVFQPFAFDTAILGEEWLDGKQITSTVFVTGNSATSFSRLVSRRKVAPVQITGDKRCRRRSDEVRRAGGQWWRGLPRAA